MRTDPGSPDRCLRPEYPWMCRLFGHKAQRRYVSEFSDPVRMIGQTRHYYRDCRRTGCYWLED